MDDRQSDLEVLREFLSLPHQSSAVLDKFAALNGAVRKSGGEEKGFVYIPGKREKGVLLVAHADTVADANQKVALEEKDGVIRNTAGVLGADDRAGCAMLWLLRESGHGLLVTDGEENGCIGARFLRDGCPDIFGEINGRYQFMVQIDRRNDRDYKCYDVGTDEFRIYVEDKTGFSEPNRDWSTDIRVLCKKICGVNLSCGYHNEHHKDEYIVTSEWLGTLALLRKWLAEDKFPKFPL